MMSITVLCYAKCTTCQKALKWLEANHIDCTIRPIREENPTEAELRLWHARSGLPLRRFFNTSGQLYKSMNLKDRLNAMSEDEQFALLASDGMLVRRPLLVSDTLVCPGFKEDEWKKLL